MTAKSRLVDTLDQGMVLDVTIEDLTFRAYVALREPDVNLVAELVPREQFEQDGDVHVAAVDQPDAAHEQIQDLAFNMNVGDCAVFLCADAASYRETLEELGQPDAPLN